jgi:hypothetical protein
MNRIAVLPGEDRGGGDFVCLYSCAVRFVRPSKKRVTLDGRIWMVELLLAVLLNGAEWVNGFGGTKSVAVCLGDNGLLLSFSLRRACGEFGMYRPNSLTTAPVSSLSFQLS